jgi:hypothetical protein
VQPISTKTELMLVGAGYAVILAFAGAEFCYRYLYEISHPEEVIAQSGMFAGGDMILAIFVGFLLMIPTLFLIWIGAKFEAPYTIYSKLLLLVGFSAPACLALLYFGSQRLPGSFAVFCFERLFCSPFILAIIAMSRLVARFDRAKQFTSYALLLEAATLCTSIGLIWLTMWQGKS